MRYHLLGLVLLAGTAQAGIAQNRAGQARPYVQPEIISAQPLNNSSGIPAGSAVANLTARLDAMERQLAALTGQNEESAHRIRQLEQQLEQAKRESEDRLRRIETAVAAPAVASEPAAGADEPVETAARSTEPVKAAADAKPAATGDAGEDAYITGFRQWEAKEYGSAQKTLEAMAKKYPKHARASYSLNLAGRAYLDEGKPATAAKILLSNYQTNPKGDRAADSLYFLGQALMQLKKAPEACKVYDELADVYPNMRDWLKQRLPKAREEAKCKG